MASSMDPVSGTTAAKEIDPRVPSTLFHTILTVVDSSGSSGDTSRTVYPLNSHATLGAAKAFAYKALQGLGYRRSDFEAYQEHPKPTGGADNDSTSWPYGNGIVVLARRPSAHDFLVGISTTPNNEQLGAKGDGSAEMQLPQGCDKLHYVLQTSIDYNADRSGTVQSTDIEGVYAHRADALAAAKTTLVGDEIKVQDFAEYDDRDDVSFKGEWPFGEDVVIHAVSQTGENFMVAVLTSLRAHELHGRKTEKSNE